MESASSSSNAEHSETFTISSRGELRPASLFLERRQVLFFLAERPLSRTRSKNPHHSGELRALRSASCVMLASMATRKAEEGHGAEVEICTGLKPLA